VGVGWWGERVRNMEREEKGKKRRERRDEQNQGICVVPK
jgi:hypothetical protein